MIIDAHQHFWKLDLPFDYAWLYEPQHKPICRDFVPETLQPLLNAVGVQKSVFVQTQHNWEEALWVLELAKQHSFIAGVVGWVDLASDHCEGQLLQMKSHQQFVGVRHITQAEPDEDFIIRPEIVRGLKVLQKHQVPFDLLFNVQHLKHAALLAQMLPDLPMVIDHLSKPQIRESQIKSWAKDLKAAAAFPNIYCKISGMITEAHWKNWKEADLKPYIDIAVEAFGPQRCMYGSDWPVCELAGTYEQVFETTTSLISQLSETEKNQILGQTANHFYKLGL